MARVPGKSIMASDDVEVGFDLGNEAAPELREGGIEGDDIEIVSERQMISKAEEAKFMEEKVMIQIDQDDDPNSPIFVYAGHGGVTQYIKRGVKQVVKRKFLYALLAAKRVKMACSFGKDNAGNEFNRLTPSASTTYRVHLLQDNNPRGQMKWFEKVSAEAA